MKKYEWKARVDADTCDTCRTANGQVHTRPDWQKSHLWAPGKGTLCGDNCRCEMEETDAPESGDLSSIPTRKKESTMPELVEQHAAFSARARLTREGDFEVVGITAGHANGWNFSAAAIQASLPLWDHLDCFVNHSWWMRDLRDLGGSYYNQQWDEELQGITLSLRPLGPSGPLVRQLGQEMLSEAEPKPDVGFSLDLYFTASGVEVIQILRIATLDLVYDPARGGAFLRALNQSQEWRLNHMSDNTSPAPAAPPAPAAGSSTAQAQMQKDADALRVILNAQEQQTAMTAEVEKMRAIRLQACAHLLDTGLAASKLPAPSQAAVRKQFAGRVFDPPELTAAIDDARELVSQLTAGAAVQGPGRISAMFNGEDAIRAAVHDLFNVARDPALQALKVAKLDGIRQLYLMFTGDRDFHGGYYAEHAQLNTGSFASIVANVMNKAVVTRWNELGRAGYDWWTKIAHVEHFTNLQQIRWLITGTIASLPVVAKGAEYTPLMIGEGHELSSFVKYGGYVGIDLEDIINDDTRKIVQTPRELANAGIRNISKEVADLFTDNAAIGPTLVDGGALFNSTAVTTAGGHLNLLTTALGTTFAAWDVVAAAVYNQPMLVSNDAGYIGTGAKLALDPKFCLVPRALKGQAEALFIPRWSGVVEAGIAASGGPTYGGAVVPITVPEWTDATDWAAVCDPMLVPGVCIGEAFGLMPEIFVAGDELSPAVFMNDEFRVKVRHHVAVGVADFRPMHKSNVA